VTFDITDRKEMEQHLARLNRIYRLLSRTNEAILRIRDRNALFQEACRIGVEEGGLRMAWAGLVDPETLLVRPVAQGGDDQGYLDEVVVSSRDVPEGRGPTGIAIRENRVVVVNDWERDPIIAPWREKGIKRGFFSSMSIPLEEENRIIGALTFYAGEPNFFTPEEVNLFKSLRDNISFGLTLLKQEQWRQQAEEAITVSEAKYRQIVETAHEGIWSVDRDFRTTFVNKIMAEWLAYEPGEIIGKPITEFFFPEDLGDFERRKEKRQRGLAERFEFRLRCRDGSELWVLVSVTPLMDDQGEFQGSFAMINDITARKTAEERYSTIIQTALDGFLLVDTQGRILEANPAYCRMSGYTQEDLAQMTVADIEAQMPPEEIAQEIQRIMATGEAAFETRHRRKDGRIIDVAVATRYIGHGEGGLFYAFLRDITERKRAEATLKESESRLAEAQRLARLGNWDWNILTNELVWSDEVYRLFGTTPQEFGATYEAFLGFVHPDDRELMEGSVKDALQEGKAYAIDHRIIRRDGIELTVHEQGEVMYDDSGQPIRMFGTVQDVTERRQAEAQIRLNQLRLQVVFDGIPEPLVMVDRELRFKLLNRAALRYYQADSSEAVVDKYCYQVLKGLAAPCAGCEVPAAVSQGEFRLYERQGAGDPARLEEVFVYPLPNGTGQEGAAIIRISDVTEARMMERHLLQSEKLASLGLLVAGIAHEINNPNSFITFNIPILRSYLQELLPIVDVYARAHPDFAVCRMPYGEFRRDIFKLVDNLEHGSSRINATVAALRTLPGSGSKGKKPSLICGR
jgi:PAS domain S-box-containing protein